MKEVVGELWNYPADWRVVTTNGSVKQNGEAVMGRGCAREARERFPALPKKLGEHLASVGNILAMFHAEKLLTFPVEHEWHEDADLRLIAESAQDLEALARRLPGSTIVLPRPGCGNGRRTWEEVRPLLEALPDNVHVITREVGDARAHR